MQLPLIIIITITLLLSYATLLFYYCISWNAITNFTVKDEKTTSKISVIIPARNEASSLPALLQSLHEQHYPKENMEVIVIDDHSTDNTAAVAASFTAVRVLFLKDYVQPAGINSYKKKAIEIGIQHSAGELIITTDADCTVPSNWLSTISAFYQEKKADFIVMPVSIACNNRFIEIFQALDFMTLQGITGASVYKKIHSMCNGANLAYTKAAFNAVNGFEGIDGIASGDDMLLMHKIYKKTPGTVHYLKSKEVVVHTAAAKSLKEFLNQRIRWASKADKYDDKRIFGVLVFVYLFNLAMLVLPLLALIAGNWAWIKYWLLLLALKTLVELVFLYPVAKFFNKQILLWWFPVAQPFHILYTVIAGFLGKFGSYEWKQRRVR